MALLLKGAHVVDPAAGLDGVLDVLIDGDRIAEVGEGLAAEGADVLDLSGKYLVPGLVDMHVHLRDPGFEHKATIETETRAAAKGGMTAVCSMPNTNPVTDNGTVVEYVRACAERAGHCRVLPSGAMTRGLKGEIISEMGDMVAHGAVAFTDDGRGVQGAGMLRRCMDYGKMFGKVFMSHCQDDDLVGEGQVFFRWYGRTYSRVLKCFTRFFVQNEASRRLLATLGVTDVEITGDTRFDRVLQIKNQAKRLPVVDAFKDGHKVFVAGSSWPPDEDIFIPYFNGRKDWKIIIAPHVIGEDHLRQIEAKLGRRSVRYTKTTEEEAKQAECLIIDCFGLLSSIYGYGDVAYVGGGFGVGIHNVLEAAVWGMPVIFGPNNARFQEAQDLKACGGGVQIDSGSQFNAVMTTYTSDDAALKADGEKAAGYVKGKAGATDKILKSVGLC